MAAQEGQLVGHDRLVLRAVVDVEVVDTRIDAQLPERGATSRLDRGAGAATWSAPPAQTSHGQCSPAAWMAGR
jgi:hypothetical protein